MNTTETVERMTTAIAVTAVPSLATNSELQSMLVGLFALAVRELIYWWTHRRKEPTFPTDIGGGG